MSRLGLYSDPKLQSIKQIKVASVAKKRSFPNFEEVLKGTPKLAEFIPKVQKVKLKQKKKLQKGPVIQTDPKPAPAPATATAPKEKIKVILSSRNNSLE